MLYAIRLVSVVAVAGLLTLPASYGRDAFGKGGGQREQEDPAKAADNYRQNKQREDAYKNAVKNIPDGKANKDPWAGAR